MTSAIPEADFAKRYGSYALILGGTETLGEQMALQLAARGMSLVVVARNHDKLAALQQQLTSCYQIEVVPLAIDLLDAAAPEKIFAATAELEIGLLFFNANLHDIGPLNQSSPERLALALKLNHNLPILFSRHYGERMCQRRRGLILFSGSLLGSLALEDDAAFQSAKAGLQVFAESLWLEYRHANVQVSCVLLNAIEGSTSLEAKASARSRRMMQLIGMQLPPEHIAEFILASVQRKSQPLIIPDHRLPVVRIAYSLLKIGHAFRTLWFNRLISRIVNSLLDGTRPGT